MKAKEKKLVQKAGKGDPRAFAKLYDAHIEPIFRYIVLRVRQKADAEDITQHVFLKAWQNIDGYEIKENIPFSSWLYKIAKNAVTDYYRTSKSDISIELVSEKNISTHHKEHEHSVDDSFKMERIQNSLEELTESEQEVIILRFVNELSNKETAEIMDKSEGAIRVAQHRALKKLKKIIEDGQENN